MRSEINSSNVLYFIIFLEGNIFSVNDVLSRKKKIKKIHYGEIPG